MQHIPYKIILFLILFSNFIFPQAAGSNGCTTQLLFVKPPDFDYTAPAFDWKLVFEDNFEGNTLDNNNWDNNYSWCARSLGTGEQEYYTDNQNIIISNGTLKITAKSEFTHQSINPCYPPNQIMQDGILNLRDFHYTSGMISSKKNYGYGKYEISCKIPISIGSWPAFWTFGGSPSGGQSEIDCFEFYDGNFNRQGTNIHSNGNTSCGLDTYDTGLNTTYHKYSVIYMPNYLEWYRDDVLIRRIDKYVHLSIGEAQSYTYAYTGQFDPSIWAADFSAFYTINRAFPEQGSLMKIIANLAVENLTWPLTFPATFAIDYIKYYTLSPCGSYPYNLVGQQISVGLNATSSSNTNFSFNQNELNLFNLNIQNGQNIQLRACSTISFNNEFIAFEGSDVLAKADLDYCCAPTSGYKINSDNDLNYNSSLNAEYKSTEKKNNKIQQNQNNNTSQVYLNNLPMLIYPNPNKGVFSIQTYNPDRKHLKIINTMGLIVYENDFNESFHEINLNFISGLYTVIVNNNEQQTKQLIIIEN